MSEKTKKPNALSDTARQPDQELLTPCLKERPERCEDTILPDTFHLWCHFAKYSFTWSISGHLLK